MKPSDPKRPWWDENAHLLAPLVFALFLCAAALATPYLQRLFSIDIR